MKYLALVVLLIAVCAPAMAHDSYLGNGHRETTLGGRQQYTGYVFGNGIPETTLSGRYDGRYYDGRYDRNSGSSHKGLIIGAIVGAAIGAYIDSRRNDDNDRRPQYRPPHCGQGGPVEYDPTRGYPVRR